MQKKTKTHIIVITVFIAVALVTVALGLFLSDALPARLSYTISRLFSTMSSPEEPAVPTDPTRVSAGGTVLPRDLYGVWLDLDTDLSIAPGDGYGALVAEADACFETYRNVLAQTIFIRPDTEEKYKGMKDAAGNSVDVLREITAHAQAKDYVIILVADDTLLFGKDGAPDLTSVRYYLSNYPFQGVLLEGDRLSQESRRAETVTLVGEELARAYPGRLLGLTLKNTIDTLNAQDDTRAALQTGRVDFALVDAGGSMRSSPSFSAVVKQWNADAAAFPQIRFCCKHRNDLVCSDPGVWSDPLEISKQVRVLWDCERILGSVFVGSAAICTNKNSSVLRLSSLLYEGDETLTELKITAIATDDERNTVTFTGTAAPGHQLRLNGVVVDADGGDFSFEYALYPGANEFRFFSCGLDKTYRIYSTAGAGAPADYPGGVSPYTDNGLGRALLCRIVNDDTETLGVLGEKNTYHADYSTLAAGTLDYVKNITLSGEGHIRYELESGFAVYGVNCELIYGYHMPGNKIVAERADDASAGSTDLYFKTDWPTVVTVKCNPQVYYSGYGGYAFNIRELTAEYAEVRFACTDEFFNLSNLQFAENSLFSRAELYKDTAGNMLLRLYLRKKGQFYGFTVDYENGGFRLSFKKHANGSLAGKVVMLDPGHGGYYMTGTAFNNKIAEKDVSLSIARKAKQMLESYGATVLMTRTLDTPLTLEERCELQAAANPDIFVSIHCDGTEPATESGTHTFYFRPYSMPLAQAIHNRMVSIYRNYIYKPTDTNYANIDKGIKFYPFFVTRLNNCPAVLCETGFMSNPIEGMVLTNDNYQYWMAQGIADGIADYFAANY